MFKSIFYNTKTSTIHLWEEIKGEGFYDEIFWVPYVFVDDENGEIETIYGNKVSKKDFNSYKQYMDFCKNNTKGYYENKVVPVIQFLAERYYKLSNEEITAPDLKIYSLDIEVNSNHGFPNISFPQSIITAITVTNFSNNKVFTFGLKELTEKLNYDYEYYNCKDEESLLKIFLNWWNKNMPDVVTGWNINADHKVNLNGGFDLPYIINRCKVLFGKETNIYKSLSPIRKVNIYQKDNGSFIVDIAGCNILDYMSLYKWYTPKNLESYSLETVCQHELGKGKVEYENDLNWLYENDWNKYVEYNMEDTFLIKDLEEKLGYIRLAQSLSLLCKCPLKMYSSTTNLVEGLMLTRFRRNGKCAPYFYGGVQDHFEAAFVKEPKPNLYNWLFSLDIASSYPHAIVTLNMSPETLYGKILNLPEDKVIEYMEKRKFPEIKIDKQGKVVKIEGNSLKLFNKAIQKRLLSVSPNGVIFYNTKRGVYAEMERDIYLKRKELKKKKFLKSKEYEESGLNKDKYEAQKLETSQLAYKTIINGAYGVLATNYSRYFCPYIAQAITSVGRNSLKFGEKYTNEILNEPNEELKEILKEIENYEF